MAYLLSEKIHVFPTSINRSNFPTARILTEQHILDLIRSVAPSDSFVITEIFERTAKFEFVVHGYYIVIEGTDISPLAFTGDEVFAHIFLDTTSSTNPQLWGNDSANIFNAVLFTDTADATPPELIKNNYEHYSLKILRKSGNMYTVPVESMKFVDGGEIE